LIRTKGTYSSSSSITAKSTFKSRQRFWHIWTKDFHKFWYNHVFDYILNTRISPSLFTYFLNFT